MMATSLALGFISRFFTDDVQKEKKINKLVSYKQFGHWINKLINKKKSEVYILTKRYLFVCIEHLSA